MTAISKAILLFLAPLLLGMAVHKFYVSVTQVEYYPPDQAIQITSRVFIDDMEKAFDWLRRSKVTGSTRSIEVLDASTRAFSPRLSSGMSG